MSIGSALFTETVIGPGFGLGGGVTIWHELWRATIDNALLEDVTEIDGGVNFYGGEINLNHDRAIRTEAKFALRDVASVSPYSDYLAVFLNRSYDDGRAEDRSQLGLYTIRVPSGTRTIERADGVYIGHDLTAVLARYAFDDTYNIAAAANYVDAVIDILELAGISRHLIEPTTQTLAAAKSFDLGATYLEAANWLLNEIGYYHLSMLPDGRLSSGPTRALQQVEPYRTITDDDLMEPVETQPLDETVANVIIVVKDDPSAAPLKATRRNDDAASPTATVNIGEITRFDKRSDLADQAAVDAFADRLLAESRSFYQTASARLLPDPDCLTPHQTVDLQLTGKLEILNGRWWVRTAGMGFSPATSGAKLELNRVTDSITGAII
jgi:hypothetical protein